MEVTGFGPDDCHITSASPIEVVCSKFKNFIEAGLDNGEKKVL